MEYYGYKDRGEAGNPIVDWGKIASDLTANLTKIEEGREAKRKEIDEVTQGFVDEIGKVDFGHSQSMGTFIQDSANSTKQYTLLQQKLLKQGKIDPNQYKMNLQNQKDSWSSFTNVTKNWNANYDRFVDMQAKGLVGQQAADQMELLGNMQNFQNKKSFIDPASGNLYVAEYDKNGNIDTTKFQPQSATGMFKIMGDIPVKVNVTAEVAKNSKIAEFKKMTAGMMVSDPTARPEYTKMADQVANSVLSTDRAIGSVLMDTVGGYTTTYQPDPSKYSAEEKAAAKAGKLIVYKRDGTGNYNPADFTPAQMEEAKKAVKDNLRSQLGYEAEPIKTSGGGGGRGGELTEAQRLALEAKKPQKGDVIPIKDTANRIVGAQLGIQNAIIKRGPGVVDEVTKLQIRNGKLQMDYITYKGSESITEDNYRETSKTQENHTIGIDNPAFSTKLRSAGFNSATEAREYLKSQSGLVDLRKSAAPTTTKSSSYKIKGKTYTFKQLSDMGYTEEDVKSYKI
jgi:hypothetical protein